jgi:hypothetical protein
VKAAFDENGIEFARREVRVAIPGIGPERELTEAGMSAIAGSAAQAVQDKIAAGTPPDPQT